MNDVFGIPTKIGDTVLYIFDNKFIIGKIIGLEEDEIYGDISVESNGIKNKIRDRNFIRINDIIDNNPQYFI